VAVDCNFFDSYIFDNIEKYHLLLRFDNMFVLQSARH
jgi:hypothetical protein